jgi:hypothetical protein
VERLSNDRYHSDWLIIVAQKVGYGHRFNLNRIWDELNKKVLHSVWRRTNYKVEYLE